MRQSDLNQPLSKAVFDRDVKQIKDLLNLGADVNATDSNGFTIFDGMFSFCYEWAAALEYDAEIIMLLLTSRQSFGQIYDRKNSRNTSSTSRRV